MSQRTPRYSTTRCAPASALACWGNGFRAVDAAHLEVTCSRVPTRLLMKHPRFSATLMWRAALGWRQRSGLRVLSGWHLRSSPTRAPAPEAITAPAPVVSAEPSVKKTALQTIAPTLERKHRRMCKRRKPPSCKKRHGYCPVVDSPVLNPETISLGAPKISSGVKASVIDACSPSTKCGMNGDQLTINEGALVTVTQLRRLRLSSRIPGRILSTRARIVVRIRWKLGERYRDPSNFCNARGNRLCWSEVPANVA